MMWYTYRNTHICYIRNICSTVYVNKPPSVSKYLTISVHPRKNDYLYILNDLLLHNVATEIVNSLARNSFRDSWRWDIVSVQYSHGMKLTTDSEISFTVIREILKMSFWIFIPLQWIPHFWYYSQLLIVLSWIGCFCSLLWHFPFQNSYGLLEANHRRSFQNKHDKLRCALCWSVLYLWQNSNAKSHANRKKKMTLFVHSEYIFTPPSRLLVVDGNLVKLNDCIALRIQIELKILRVIKIHIQSFFKRAIVKCSKHVDVHKSRFASVIFN